jgi:quinol monooxygenase YgiN
MKGVHLVGHLICRTAAEAELVARHLPDHIGQTRAEPGCVSFDVVPTDNPLIWSVAEVFDSRAAFESHQARVVISEWGRATAHITRRYIVRDRTI